MWRKSVFFLLFFLLCCLFRVSAQDQRFYLISEMELQSIEKVKQNWETSKQSWLSQVSVLKTDLENLQTASKTLVSKLETSQAKSMALQAELVNLNKDLAAERTTSKQLKKSFETFADEKLQQLTLLSSEVASQREKTLEAEKRLSFWRLLAIVVIGVIILVIILIVYTKLRPRLPAP